MRFFRTHRGNCLPIFVTLLFQACATSIMFFGGPPPWPLLVVLFIFYFISCYAFAIMYNEVSEEEFGLERDYEMQDHSGSHVSRAASLKDRLLNTRKMLRKYRPVQIAKVTVTHTKFVLIPKTETCTT